MRVTLKVSILLNLVLFCGLIFILMNRQSKEAAPATILTEDKTPAQAATTPDASPPSGTAPASFHWSQLVSARDYRRYVANLRAIGCPEPTIEDIVRGDTDRAFSWERTQLGLDGSGAGPWSRQAEMRLVASLLAEQPTAAEATAAAPGTQKGTEGNGGGNVMAESTGPASSTANHVQGVDSGGVAESSVSSSSAATATPAYPLFLQNVNWSALGFSADQQSAIAQVREQFQNEINSMNQLSGNTANQNTDGMGAADTPSNPNPNATTALTQWQTALQNADDQLQALLGAQGYAAYEQQQYYAWYQPQVLADARGAGLTIDPRAFSLK